MPTSEQNAHMYRKITLIGITLFALAIMFLPHITHAIQLIPCNGGVTGYDASGNAQYDECTWDDLLTLINNVIDFIIYTVVVFWAGIVFTWGGFLILTSGDNPGKRKQAKAMFINLIIGVIIVLIAWLGIHAILTALGCTDCLKLIDAQ